MENGNEMSQQGLLKSASTISIYENEMINTEKSISTDKREVLTSDKMITHIHKG